MARKRRPREVVPRKGRDPLHCGTITVEDQLKMERSARRQAEIESGVKPGSGSGAHGGNKRQRRRKERRQGKTATRNWDQ